MIPGGAADAGIFAGLARCLADRYTVVAYDPRGNSRSTFEGPPEEQQLDVHADDAARLIEALGGEPAFVLGSSGGGQIGLNLAARHPERVRVLVAHEPPCVNVLSDPSEELAGMREVYDTYRRQGVGPAGRKFMELAGLGGGMQQSDASPQLEPTPEVREAFARMQANLDYFFAHGPRRSPPTSPMSKRCARARCGSSWASAKLKGSWPIVPRSRWPTSWEPIPDVPRWPRWLRLAPRYLRRDAAPDLPRAMSVSNGCPSNPFACRAGREKALGILV